MSVLFDPKIIADQARDELLASDPVFSTVPVISADPGEIETTINAALEQLNIGVLILPVSMHSSKPNLQGPFFDQVKLSAMIIESPTLNRVGDSYVTAQNLSVVIAGVLHWFAPSGINERFLVRDVMPLPTPKPDEDQPVLNIWYVEMTGGGGIGYNKGTIAPVTATYADNQVTLACATPGAAIWFTTDGSYPGPANPTAHLAVMQQSFLLDDDMSPIVDAFGQPTVTTYISYPIPVAPGTKLLARGWRSGLNPTKPDIQSFQY